MTDSLATVVIPYTRFVECQKRRQQVTAELERLKPARMGEAVEADMQPPAPADRLVPQAATDKQI